MTRFVETTRFRHVESMIDPANPRETDLLWMPRTPAALDYARRVAYHEAGHVVVGLLVGDMPIIEAGLVTSDDRHAVRRESPFENCPEGALPRRMVRGMVTSGEDVPGVVEVGR